MRFFWLPLSMMKCRGVPFTHICEWKSGKQDEKVVSMMGADDEFSEIPLVATQNLWAQAY
jgi:hypothetical protein